MRETWTWYLVMDHAGRPVPDEQRGVKRAVYSSLLNARAHARRIGGIIVECDIFGAPLGNGVLESYRQGVTT